jgi:glycosyltransferase involved in cell wall biosynthesis
MKISILQNSVGIGGRSKVLAEAISVFSEIAKTIDLHTLSNDRDSKKFLNYYNIDKNNIQVIKHQRKFIPGTIYQQIALNYLAKDILNKYDLVFNSNNCLRFLPKGPEYLHYVHFPIPSTPEVDHKYDSLIYRIGALPIQFLSKVNTPRPPGKIYANSNFTREYIQKNYPKKNVDVLYPPALDNIRFEGFSGSGVVSVGSFHTNKRQLFQLKIASRFPETTFRIVGSKASNAYFRRCKNYVQEQGLENVQLLPDLSDEKLKQLLLESQIFLHSMKNERFGIATAEALNSGCVPVVHDSGGQQEVVPFQRFRYSNESDCVQTMRSVLQGSQPPETKVYTLLEEFTKSKFQNILWEDIQSRLDN